ncbi:hypothetical protein Terro_4358 [Terriglobus roseus DSM 18391]|uniref:Outer membrane protein beta-barrel domain-containing protein n=1 Tax=Terriglobus roseus (strain DSM 18391 / NRRL B-41598 / KBS 63) TaxID=926566 RepID=I3ZMT7_TERRK|nr:hypothetical protein [Terriglobus roseus]AFL90555.1 hypothetical protein Terro_4358 [Terriglobus roseus DSM 18391]
MLSTLKRSLPLLALLAVAAKMPAQFYKYLPEHGGSISVGATGNFVKPLTTNPSPYTFNSVVNGVTLTNTVTNQEQYITSSVGFLTSVQFHPVSWAGVEVNYGYQHYSERFNYNITGRAATQVASIPTTTHEATAAYQFHPKHIPFQPFVNIGGGAIDFVPTAGGQNQWRGAGLVETGFEIAMPNTGRKLALRLQGRGLFYRAPNFNNAALSTRSWRVNAEPSASFVYRF